MPPRVLLRLVVGDQRLAVENLVPLLEADHGLDHAEVALTPYRALVVAGAFARIVLVREQVLHPLHRVVVAAAEVQCVNQEVDVVTVVAGRVERVGRDPLLFIRRRGRERRDRFLDLVALRVDVTGHVQRVRDVRHQTGVALVRAPRFLRRLAAFVGVNQIMMRAELTVILGDHFFEQTDGFQRVRARFLAGRFEAVIDCETEHRLRFEIRGELRDECAHSGDVRRVGGFARAGRAPGRLRLDVEPLARRHRVAQRHRLGDRFTRADLWVERGAVGRADHRLGVRFRRGRRRARAAAVGRIAKELERGAVVAGRAQRDAPVGHRHVLVELQRLRARPF